MPQNSQNITVTAFLGGTTFSALVYIAQTENTLHSKYPSYFPFEIVLIISALCSILFIFSTIGRISIAESTKHSPESGNKTKYEKFVNVLAEVGSYMMIIGLIPGLLLPFNTYMAFGIMLFGLILISIMLKLK